MIFKERSEWCENMPNDLGKSNCPFCKEDSDRIVWNGQYWKIVYNKYPYLGLKNHLMVVPHKHIIYTKDIPANHWNEMKKVE